MSSSIFIDLKISFSDNDLLNADLLALGDICNCSPHFTYNRCSMRSGSGDLLFRKVFWSGKMQIIPFFLFFLPMLPRLFGCWEAGNKKGAGLCYSIHFFRFR